MEPAKRDDMYACVRPAQTKRDLKLPILLAVVVLVIGATVIPVVYSMWYRTHHWNFVSALSDSTVYAYDHDCLRAELDGEVVRVTGEHDYDIFGLLTEKTGRLLRSVPDRQADATLDYGDGSTLELWEVELTDASALRSDGTLWRYVDSGGEIWIYDSDAFSYTTLSLKCSMGNNQAWQG